MSSTPTQSTVDTGTANTGDQETFSYLLSSILAETSYCPKLQQQYFSFFSKHILPHLAAFPNWGSNLTHNGSCFEPSRNVQNGESVLRFCFDPISATAGTRTDRFNQAISLALVDQYEKLNIFEGFDRELWDFFTKELYVWDTDEISKVLNIKEIRKLRSCLFAFDLKKKEFEIMLKGYINVFRKAHILEISPAVVLFGAIKSLPGRIDEKVSLDKLEQFLVARDGGYEGIRNMARCNIAEVQGLNVVMVSFDFLPSLKARIKIYARSYDLKFSNFKDAYTLGGKLRAAVSSKELNVFTTFYRVIFNLPSNWDGITELVERQNMRHSGVLWQFELAHGKQVPEIKLYVSLWNFVANDAEAATRLKRFFRTQSWNQLEESYSAEVDQFFGTENVNKEAGRHSYVSFSYSEERGPYLTLYYAPKLHREM